MASGEGDEVSGCFAGGSCHLRSRWPDGKRPQLPTKNGRSLQETAVPGSSSELPLQSGIIRQRCQLFDKGGHRISRGCFTMELAEDAYASNGRYLLSYRCPHLLKTDMQ